MGTANMTKKVKMDTPELPAATEAAPAAAAPALVTHYTVLPPKRPLTGLKYGASGNAYTHSKLAEEAKAQGGTLTAAQAMAVCKQCSHQGFYSYAVNRLRVLVPVVQAKV